MDIVPIKLGLKTPLASLYYFVCNFIEKLQDYQLIGHDYINKRPAKFKLYSIKFILNKDREVPQTNFFFFFFY